ncbi:cilia- and flagella-associated protein 69 isoform X6 [Hydra vulgaris]|uniref:Cilia- and flagella-associated protein 69 isoform X6 n=1 Tax=Hydra vulgaris TaxID=6087 RepID=A0ABM4CWB9_HYDVU
MEIKNQMDIKLIKIFNLLTDKHSRCLVDRHTYLVNKYVINSKGIHLIDFQLFTDVFWKCQELIAVNNCYEVIVCMLCDILKKPLLKQKASDEEKLAKEIAECLNTLGEIAELSTDLIKSSISKTIAYMYVTSSEFDASGDVNVVSSNFIKTAISSSTICTSIVKCLAKVLHIETSYDIILSLFKLSDSSQNCDGMLKADVGNLLCKILFDMNLNNRSVFIEIGFLWNLFENGNQEEVSKQVCTDFGLSVINQVFTHQVSNCISNSDKQLRNDILIVILYAASASSVSQTLNSQLLKTISIFVSYPEIESRLDLVQNIKIISSQEDFEFKKQLMISLVLFCKDKACAKIFSEYYVMAALFTYVKPIILPLDFVWSITEFEEIQLQAMAVLASLVPYSIEEYISLQGNTRLLLLLEWCVSSAEYNSHGNCFYGKGGRGGKRAQMRFCIRLLRSVCSTENKIVLQDLFDQGAIIQISEILQRCCLSEKDELDVEMQSDMLFILSILTQDDNHKKELFGESGVKTLLMYLRCYLNNTNNVLNFSKLALTTLDCIRACVIGCAINEITFLENEGAFVLLDILQKCSFLIKTAALGILLDLSENRRTLDHLKLWQGKKESTLGNLLLHFWIAEEQRLGVLRSKHGLIDDLKKPIMTKLQRVASLVNIPEVSSSIFDVTDNIRAKIYNFKVSNLNTQEAIALSIIRRYLDFKALEIWQEIQTELEVENVKLVESDKKCLDVIIEKLESKVQLVANNQKKILQKCLEEEINEERDYFQKFKDSQKQKEKSCIDFSSFVERTSDYNCLQRARMKQLDLIEKSTLKSRYSLQQSGIKDCYLEYVTKHSTVDKRLTTTTFSGRHVIVHSTNLDPSLKPSLDMKHQPIKLPELMN